MGTRKKEMFPDTREEGSLDLAGRRALSMAEAANALGVSRAFAYILRRRGELKTFVSGRRRLVSVRELDCYIAARERAGG